MYQIDEIKIQIQFRCDEVILIKDEKRLKKDSVDHDKDKMTWFLTIMLKVIALTMHALRMIYLLLDVFFYNQESAQFLQIFHQLSLYNEVEYVKLHQNVTSIEMLTHMSTSSSCVVWLLLKSDYCMRLYWVNEDSDI